MSSRAELAEARLLGYREGYYEGVAAARDAVAALPHDTYCVTRDENYKRPCNCPVDEALAAIDALTLERHADTPTKTPDSLEKP